MKNLKSKIQLLACLSMLLSFVNSYSQNIIGYDCGILKSKEVITEWINIDTLSDLKKCDTIKLNIWTESEWISLPLSMSMTSEFNPCKVHNDNGDYQRRVNECGIVQQRKRYIKWWYEPRPKTDYELKVESFNK